METFKINYKSDFVLRLASDAGWGTAFTLEFWTKGTPTKRYYATHDGSGNYTNCKPDSDTELRVMFDDHGLGIGNLMLRITYSLADKEFRTGKDDEVVNVAAITVLNDEGEEVNVMLSLEGETAPLIQYALPLLDNELERRRAEQERIEAEEERKSNEATRMHEEAERVDNEYLRVSNENKRKAAEQSRAENENARVAAENERLTNENLRQQQEDERRATFEQTQEERAEAYLAKEAARQADFEAKEESRQATFEANEAERQVLYEKVAKNTEGVEMLNANTGISEYPLFDEATAYTVGDIVLYEGLMYRFISEHAVGVWDASQVVDWSEKKERKEEINNLTNNTNNKTYTTSAKANLIIRKIYLDVSGYTGEYELTNLRIVRIAKAASGKIYGVRISTKNTDEIVGNFWGENVGNKVSFVTNGIYGYFEYNWDNMEGSTLDFYNNPAYLTTEAFNPINDPRDSVSIDMLPDKSITRAKLQDDVLTDLSLDNFSQEVMYAINNPSPKDAYRLLPCNTIANINTLSPSMYFLQDDNGDKSNWVKVVNTVDRNSPFANILGTSVVFENNKLGQDVSAYKWEEVGYADAKRTETPKNIKISFWVNVDELTIPNEVSPLFCLATSSVKLFLEFLPWLRVAKKNVGYYEEGTHTISGLFTAIIKISQVCAIRQWKQIIWEFSNIEWDLQGAKWMFGMAFNGLTKNLSKLTLVNIQIVEDGYIPIGLYTLPDNQDYLGYPNDLTILRNTIANNKSNIDNILHLLSGDKTNYLYFNKDINETSYLLSDFDDDYLFKLEFIARRAGTLEINPCFNFVNAKLVRKVDGTETLIHNMPDEIAPSNFNASYIGANHGHSDCRSVTVISHGKTASDIGSVWANAEGKQITLVGILDENTLLFFGYNMLLYPKYSFNTNIFTSGATFSHVEGAIHTEGITLNSNGVLWQFKSAMPTPKLTLIADGIEIHESGEYRFKELNICEDYDILNVASVIEKIKARAGTFTETPNPNTLIDADKVVRHSIIYNFSSAYDWRVVTNFIAYQDINLGFFGYTQQSPLNGSINMYIPKTLPISDGTKTIDFRTIVPYDEVKTTMNITSEYWESETAVPDRWLQISPYVGLHSGFMYDYGIGGLNRKELIDSAFYLYTSRKIYPRGIDSKIKVNSGDCYSAVVWRNYIPVSKINKNGIISVNQFEYNRAHYIYGDYNQSGVFTINIPPKYVGKPIEILESSSNVSLLSNISTSDLLVKVDENTPMYGYIVMKIEEL